MSIEITVNSSMDSVNKVPEFSSFADFIAPSAAAAGDFAATPFSAFEPIGWNPASICDGYIRLRDICRNGKRVFYPLYTEDEIRKTPSLRESFLVHFAIDKKAPFVITCAGGAYLGCASMIEAYPTCKQLNELGYHAFSLNYRAGANASAPNPLEDLAYAVSYIFAHAEELNVDTENYAVAGFSAGGHLAACFGTENIGWKHYGIPRPGAVFLAYPVITMGNYCHEQSRDTLLGVGCINNPQLLDLYSAEKQVTAAYPPTFVWQCEKDNTVPIKNTQLITESLKQHQIPYIYETFDSDAHGWGAGEGTLADGWIKRAVDFWQAL